jgi:hypothetical protein
MRALKTLILMPLAAMTLTACPPPIYPKHQGDYDLAFAKSYFRAQRGSKTADLSSLTLDQIYALDRLGRERMHHGHRLPTFEEYVRRGDESVRFLRTKLEQANHPRAVDTILSLLRALQKRGSYDPRRDPSFIGLIQQTAARHDSEVWRLRDDADEIATGSDLPSTIGSSISGLWRNRGEDYDDDFAGEYCRGCDYLETMAEADRLPIDQLYSIQRYNWEQDRPRNFNRYMARRGAEAVAFYKAKLAGKGSGEMVWNILATLELMRDLGTFDVAGDAELMRLAEAAVARLKGWDKHQPADVLERLKTGAKHPLLKPEER